MGARMGKKKPNATTHLLRWTKSVPASEVQDPLGLGLRGSTRLASRLLFCITSVTRRARYFAFIPWCVYHFQKHEQSQAYAFGLRQAIKVRETALTLACIIHHDGRPCDGGGLVGSNKATHWDRSKPEANFKQLDFAKVPALDVYFNSLVNLGCFVADEERPDTDELSEESEFTFDDIQLSPMGLKLAEGYESLVGRLDSVKSIAASHRKCSTNSLREWGKRGGLCELTDSAAPDQRLLIEMFFAKGSNDDRSHLVRNQSLVCILELCRQLSDDDWCLDASSFSQAVYYGLVVNGDGDRINIDWPSSLMDIATRWRMFYFHYYMSVALEAMFVWLVNAAVEKGIQGTTTEELASRLNDASVRRELKSLLESEFPKSFGTSNLADFFASLGIEATELNETTSKSIDNNIGSDANVAECWLEGVIRDRTYLNSATGLAVPMILFVLTLARYRRWCGTDYENWLASTATDPYVDLVPPVVNLGLERHFGDWWRCSWSELADFVLARFVVQQHQSMAYEKTMKGERCLLQVDGAKIRAELPHEKIGIGNPRFHSAVQILTDLGLLKVDENDVIRLTQQGDEWLRSELMQRANP
jgi:hypothetical protein